jgi:hypothetical protein
MIATLHFVNAGPSEEMLARGPWDADLLIKLRDKSAENIAQKLEETTDIPKIEDSYLAIAQREGNEFSLVDWFFFGGECFDSYTLYDNIAKRQTDTNERQKYQTIADKYHSAYSIAAAKATELVRSQTQIVNGIDNCQLVKYFLTSWLHPKSPMQMQISLGIWRQYKGVILIALKAYYNVAVKPENDFCGPHSTNIRFYKNYARAIKAAMPSH